MAGLIVLFAAVVAIGETITRVLDRASMWEIRAREAAWTLAQLHPECRRYPCRTCAWSASSGEEREEEES